jgi:hypothetical protein
MFKKIYCFFVKDMDFLLALNVATFENISFISIICNYFIFFIYGYTDIKKAIKAMLPYVIWGKTDIKSLLGNPGNNKENNSKPDHNHSELGIIPLTSKKQIAKIFFNI